MREPSAPPARQGIDPAAAGGTPTATGLLRRVCASSANNVMGFADQAVVSLASFAVTVMVGRWTDAGELGAYGVGFSILILMIAAQESLITRPYAVYVHRPLGTPQQHASSALMLSVALGLSAALVAGAAATALSLGGANADLVSIAWALAGAVPFVLLREFARRSAFARLAIGRALAIDAAAAVFTLTGVGILGWSGRLSAAGAIGALGLSCGLTAAGWLILARAQFAADLARVRDTLKRSWNLGKWFLSGQIAVQTQGYAVSWLSLVMAGATMTGVYTAAASIVAFSNPVIFGFCNVFTPKYVGVLKSDGVGALRRRVARDSLLLGAAMGVFCIAVAIAGDDIMRLLYRGAEYAGHGQVLTVLALASLMAAIGAPASLALAAAERGRPVAGVMGVTAALTVLLVAILLPRWGLLGASYAILLAETAGCFGRWTTLLIYVARAEREGRDGFEPAPPATQTS